jgi:hypothetical protein
VRYRSGVEDPGLDRHEWETEWEALEPLVVDSPEEALPELDDLVGRMLAERGYPVEEEETEPASPVEEGVDPEVMAAFRVAREISRRVEDGEDVPPGDVAHAVGLYRELYDHLLVRLSHRR